MLRQHGAASAIPREAHRGAARVYRDAPRRGKKKKFPHPLVGRATRAKARPGRAKARPGRAMARQGRAMVAPLAKIFFRVREKKFPEF